MTEDKASENTMADANNQSVIPTLSADVDKRATKNPLRQEKTRSSFKETLKKKLKSGLHWLWKDMKKTHLLWVKVIFLFQSASLITLYPYLTIHMRSLGFSIEDTAIVNSAVPLADIFGPPIAGLLADKIGNFRIFMGVVTFLNGAASLLLLFVPPVKERLDLCCDGSSDNLILSCTDPSLIQAASFNASETIVLCQSPENGTLRLDASFANTTINPPACNLDCYRSVPVSDDDWISSFTFYLCVRVILDVLRASSLMLFEGAVVVIIKEHGGDYGLQKLFGTAGAVIFGPLAGKVIDLASNAAASKENYTGIFILYFILRLVAAIFILKLSLGFKPPAKKVFKDLGKVLCSVQVLVYLFAFMVAGMLWGFLETFLFWYMEDLGATKFLMGISLAVGTLAGVPLTIFSRLLIRKLGHNVIVILALTLYSLRMLGYGLILLPELSLLFEFLKPACTTLLLISAMNFVKDVSPMTATASMEGIFGSLYFGVGRGLGGLVGAYIWEAFGARQTFRIFSCISVGSAPLYMCVILIRTKVLSSKYVLPKNVEKNQHQES